MLKILHITTWYPNKYDHQLGVFIQKHINQGHSFAKNVVMALIPRSDIRTLEIVVNKESETTEIIAYYPARPNKFWANYKYKNAAVVKMLQKFLELNFKPDVIHCHVGDKSLALANKFFKDYPTILTEHWSGFLDGRFNQLSSFSRNKRIKLTNKCDAVICVSEHLKTAMKDAGITAEIKVIPNIINYKRVKESFNENLKFLVVSDLVDEIKNISGIIEAFKTAFNNTDESLTIIGDGKDMTMLRDLTKDSPNISFLGRKDNEFVLENLPKYDVLIVNSKFETFSMITAEALLSGVPVIATRCGGPEQFIIEDVNGILVPVNDTKALSNAFVMFKHKINILKPKHINNSVLEKINIKKIQTSIKSVYDAIERIN